VTTPHLDHRQANRLRPDADADRTTTNHDQDCSPSFDQNPDTGNQSETPPMTNDKDTHKKSTVDDSTSSNQVST
jgi:hypothetical protein